MVVDSLYRNESKWPWITKSEVEGGGKNPDIPGPDVVEGVCEVGTTLTTVSQECVGRGKLELDVSVQLPVEARSFNQVDAKIHEHRVDPVDSLMSTRRGHHSGLAGMEGSLMRNCSRLTVLLLMVGRPLESRDEVLHDRRIAQGGRGGAGNGSARKQVH